MLDALTKGCFDNVGCLQKLQKLIKKSKDPNVIEELKNHVSWIVSLTFRNLSYRKFVLLVSLILPLYFTDAFYHWQELNECIKCMLWYMNWSTYTAFVLINYWHFMVYLPFVILVEGSPNCYWILYQLAIVSVWYKSVSYHFEGYQNNREREVGRERGRGLPVMGGEETLAWGVGGGAAKHSTGQHQIKWREASASKRGERRWWCRRGKVRGVELSPTRERVREREREHCFDT